MGGPLSGGGGYTLGKTALQQISQVVQAYNGGGGARKTDRNHYRPVMTPPGLDGVTTTAISPATVANNGQKTYGVGTVMIFQPVVSNNGAVVSTNDPAYGTQNAINPYTNNGNAIANNTQVTLAWRGGFLMIQGANQC
jgi:hypothetical protein